MTRITTSLAVLLCTAAPLVAQHANHPEPAPGAMPPAGMMASDSTMAAMHRLLAFAPARVLERATVLGLSADQQSRVDALARRAGAARERLVAATGTRRAQLASRLGEQVPDAGGITRTFEQMHAAMGAMHANDLRAAVETMALLTESQRAQLLAAGVPEGCPMMAGHAAGGAASHH